MAKTTTTPDNTACELIIDLGCTHNSLNGLSMTSKACILVRPTEDIETNTDKTTEQPDVPVPTVRVADAEIRKIVEASRSEAAAARALNMHRNTLRRHLDRLGVTPDFRIGARRLPPDSQLKHDLLSKRNLASLAKEYGVSATVLAKAAKRLRVDGAFKPRVGLPKDEVLREILERSLSVTEAAEQLGCAYYMASNQYARLGVARPSQRNEAPNATPVQMIDSSDVADLAKLIVGSQAGWQIRFAKYIRYPQETVTRWLCGDELMPVQEYNALYLRFGIRQLKDVA
jgi:transposase-like protein